MSAPWLVDDGGAPWALCAYSGQGGTAKGLQQAGFRVVAVDIDDHSARNPAEVFIVADAPEFIEQHGHEFAVRAAGPPCQGYSIATAGNPAARAKYPRHIALVRDLFSRSPRPWVIENVEQARLQMVDPILLCGRMFGLRADDEDGVPLALERHRLFESNVPLVAPKHPRDREAPGEFTAGVYGGSRRAPTRYIVISPDGLMADTIEKLPAKWKRFGVPEGWTCVVLRPEPCADRLAARVSRGGGYVPRSIAVQQRLLGIDWMTVKGMQESIPPAYSEHIGRQLMSAHLERTAA